VAKIRLMSAPFEWEFLAAKFYLAYPYTVASEKRLVGRSVKI